jgi:hypothetical protein
LLLRGFASVPADGYAMLRDGAFQADAAGYPRLA